MQIGIIHMVAKDGDSYMCTVKDSLLQSSISIKEDYKSDCTQGSWYIVG